MAAQGTQSLLRKAHVGIQREGGGAECLEKTRRFYMIDAPRLTVCKLSSDLNEDQQMLTIQHQLQPYSISYNQWGQEGGG